MRYLILLLSLLLVSCSDNGASGSVYFVSVARDYSGYSVSNQLETPPQDQEGLSDELFYLSFSHGVSYTEYLFLEKDGEWTINGARKAWDTSAVLETLSALDAGKGDLVILHYSGHGTESGALVMDDDCYLEIDELLSVIETVGGKKLLILDSCYSGLAVEDSAVLSNGESFSGTKLESTSWLSSALTSFGLIFSGRLESLEDVWVLAAATAEQTSWDSWDTGEAGQEDYGAFSYQVLKALGYDFSSALPGSPDSSPITLYGLYSTIMDNISDDLRKIATPQVTLSLIDLVLF